MPKQERKKSKLRKKKRLAEELEKKFEGLTPEEIEKIK